MPRTIPFQYTPYTIVPSKAFPQGQTLHRPIILAHIIAPSTKTGLTCLVWPDSGADHPVFPLSFALQLGLNPLTMPPDTMAGIGNQANTLYFEPIDVVIPLLSGPPLTFSMYAGFTQGMDALGLGLLGQCGFFEKYGVHFDHTAKMFYVHEP